MDVSSYIVLMLTGLNVTWPDSQCFASMRVKLLDVTSANITEVSTEHITAAGGWLQRWHHIYHRGPRKYKTVEFCDIPWVRCREETVYHGLLAELMSSLSSADSVSARRLTWYVSSGLLTGIGRFLSLGTFMLTWIWRLGFATIGPWESFC